MQLERMKRVPAIMNMVLRKIQSGWQDRLYSSSSSSRDGFFLLGLVQNQTDYDRTLIA
jgi:hypothetical protein